MGVYERVEERKRQENQRRTRITKVLNDEFGSELGGTCFDYALGNESGSNARRDTIHAFAEALAANVLSGSEEDTIKAIEAGLTAIDLKFNELRRDLRTSQRGIIIG